MPAPSPPPAQNTAGVWFCTSLSTQLPPHEHAGSEFNLLLSGSLTYLIAGAKRQLEAGQLLVLPAHTEHHLLEASQDAAFWVLELQEQHAASWWQSSAVFSLPAQQRQRLMTQLRKLWCRPKAEALHQELLKLSALLEEPPSADAQPPSIHPAVSRARALCEGPDAHELDVGQIAKLAGISSSRLAHLFQEQLGISPLQYLNFAKIQRFVGNYQDDSPSLMRTALQQGFGSYPQFHRTFLQVCGAPPGAHLQWLASDERVAPGRRLNSAAR